MQSRGGALAARCWRRGGRARARCCQRPRAPALRSRPAPPPGPTRPPPPAPLRRARLARVVGRDDRVQQQRAVRRDLDLGRVVPAAQRHAEGQRRAGAARHGHRDVRVQEGRHLGDHAAPLGRVGRRVLHDVGGDERLELLQQLPHLLAPVEQQADDDEAREVAQLLDRKVRVGRGLREVAAAADGLVEDVRLVQEADLARAQVVVVVQLPDLGRDVADLPPLHAAAGQHLPVLLLELPQLAVDVERLVEVVLPADVPYGGRSRSRLKRSATCPAGTQTRGRPRASTWRPAAGATAPGGAPPRVRCAGFRRAAAARAAAAAARAAPQWGRGLRAAVGRGRGGRWAPAAGRAGRRPALVGHPHGRARRAAPRAALRARRPTLRGAGGGGPRPATVFRPFVI